MKDKIFLSLLIGMILAVGLTFAQQQKRAEEIFKDAKTIDEILNYIVGNHGLMIKLLDKAIADKRARDMMMDRLMSYAEKDTAMAENMCEMMMGGKNMMRMMKKMMQGREKEGMEKKEHMH